MTWKIDDNHATWDASGDWNGTLDLNHPELGLQWKADAVVSASLVGVDFVEPRVPLLSDCFIRQNDLIAVYPQRDSRRFTVQIDYRLLENVNSGSDLLIEMWVSIQTYFLDTHPQLRIRLTDQHLMDGDIDCWTSKGESLVNLGGPSKWAEVSDPIRPKVSGSPDLAAVTAKLPVEHCHVAWLLHPRDQADSTWSFVQDSWGANVSLFGHFMEKGVIRRGRLRCLVSRSAISKEVLGRHYLDFVRSPLPLTA